MMKHIYYNGDVLTPKGTAQAVLAENGWIRAVGTKEDILPMQDPNTQLFDLQGCTLMPGFIDAHSHLSAVANGMLQPSLTNCRNFDDVASTLEAFGRQNNIKSGEWILAKDYDQNRLQEQSHPPRQLLDQALPENPVVLQHTSGHCGVFSSLALQKLGITEQTKAPSGGTIEQKNGVLTGFMEENAFVSFIKKIPMPDANTLTDCLIKAQKLYFSYGITTAQEGMLAKELLPLYQTAVGKNALLMDVVAFPGPQDLALVEKQFPDHLMQYRNRLKIGGIKIFTDGSPQVKTAWMRTPYLGGTDCGYGVMSDADVLQAVQQAANRHMQILCHCNGDRACEQFIKAVANVPAAQQLRPVIVHAQFLGADQLEAVARQHMIPSFFVAHVWHWGDVHIKNVGKQRADLISPAMSACKHHILFTFHQDAPVIQPDMFETIWCAVNRETSHGVVLGKSERIGVKDAIDAVTINAAYQYFEEKEKGSIEPSKKENLIVVSQNPLKIHPADLKDIKVLKTIREGEIMMEA